MAFEIYVIDTETTGLDRQVHDIIEVSFHRISDNEQKTWYLRAVNPGIIEERALKVNKHKLEDILWKTAFGRETYKEPSIVVQEIESWIMCDDSSVNERAFIGQNPTFDFDFLKELWRRCGSESSFPFGDFILDTVQLARFIDLCTGKRRKFYNLSNLVKDFGVVKGKAHKASEDVKMTLELFKKIYDPMKEFVGKTFEGSYYDG